MARMRTAPTDDVVEGNGWVPPPLPQAPALPPPRRRRRPALLALAVAMVVLGALGAAYLATSLGQTTSVIAVAQPVAWGQTITAADLVEARIAAEGGRFPVKYYLTAMLFIIFDIEALFLYPFAVAFDELGAFTLAAVVLFLFNAFFIADAYVWRRGGFEWD